MCDKTKTEFNFDVEKYTQTDKQTPTHSLIVSTLHFIIRH